MADSTGNSERVSRRREKRKKINKIKTASIILIGVVLLYLIAAVVISLSSNLSTTIALSGSVVESVRTTGYVFRDQTIVNSPSGGHLECVVGEGERVKEGQVLGYVYENEPDPEITEQIRSLHKMAMAGGIDGSNVLYSSGAASAEKRISDLARDLSDMRKNADLKEVRGKKDEIDMAVSRKQNSDESGKEAMSISDINAKINMLVSQAGIGRAIKAPVGGVFSTRIDGLEEKLSVSAVTSVTPSYLKEADGIKTEERQEVESGQPICKIINNYSWYYAAAVSEEKAADIKEGQSVQLDFYDLSGTKIKGRVARISETENKERAIVISTDKYVEGIYSSSRINADIITVSVEGIKLPSGCLHVKDGETGVYVVRLDVARFVPINLIYKNDDWAIVSANMQRIGQYKLQIYDEVVIDCKNLEDGKRVR